MTLQKTSILFLILLTIFLQPKKNPQFNLTSGQKDQVSKINPINPEELRSEIKKLGWNNFLLMDYQNYLINSKVNFENELKLLQDLPGNYEKTYLQGLILKRQNKLNEMFDLLLSVIDKHPDYLQYYNKLVFAGSATNQLQLIENKIKKDNSFPSNYSNYLIGLINSSRGNYKKALEILGSSDKNFLKLNDAAYELSYLYRNTGNYKKANEILDAAIKNSLTDEWFLVDAYLAKGALYFFSDNYNEAENYYKKGYGLSLKLGFRQSEAKALVGLGIISDGRGNVEEARNNFNKSLQIANDINDIDTKAYTLSELGVSFSFTNDLIKAKKNYIQSYQLYKTIGNKLRLSFLSDNLGKIFMQMFDYFSALKYYNEGVEFAGDNKRAKILNYIGLADVYSNLSNYTKALYYYREAQKLSEEIKEVSLNTEINYGLGALNFNLDRYQNALNYFLSADKLSGQAENPFLTADIFNKLGIVLFRLDSLAAAENYFNKSISLAKKYSNHYTEALSEGDLAALFLSSYNSDKKYLTEAEKHLQNARKISGQKKFDYLLAEEFIIAGEVAEKKINFDAAKNNYQSALTISRNLNEFNIQIEANYKLAKLFEKNNLIEGAESYYKSAIALIEDVSRPLFEGEDVQISYFASKRDVYNSFAEFYLNKNLFKEAFELIDRSRSRNTMQNLNNLKLHALINDEEILNRIYEYDWLIHSGIYAEGNADSVKFVFALMKQDLIKKNPEVEKYLNIQETLSVNDIQNNLSEKENIVSIFSTNKATYLFLITKNDFYPFVINVSREEIHKYVSEISPYFSDNTENKTFYNQDLFSFNAQSAYKLYKKIFEQVAEKIPHNEELIIIPSTELISLPFEFLVANYDAKESAYNYSNKDYLIFNYSISYSPSAAIYLQQKSNNLSNINKVLIVGDPAINNNINGFAERRGLLDEENGLPRNIAMLPLKYSGEEISQIGNIISADKILVSRDATETNFKENAELSRVIHLSTHSFLYNKQPLIFFSNTNDKENDGFLEAGEIVQLKLNSDLVVLSSCNSGLGTIDASEGIIGMTKAFFEAGTKSIVVSLWEVNDKYTSKLMALFYEKLSEGYDKSEALRKAKLEFIKEYSPNPYYWGAFVLSGNISRIPLKGRIEIFPLLIAIALIITMAASVIILKKKPAKL